MLWQGMRGGGDLGLWIEDIELTLYLDEHSSGKLDDPLYHKPELKPIDRMSQSLDLFAVLDSEHWFSQAFSLMQCQLIRSQVKQLPPEVYITITCIWESQNFQNMFSSKVHFW